MTKAENYRVTTVGTFAQYQQFIHDYMSPVDVESSQWLFDVPLQLSIEPTLLLQLNQTHESYPEVQQGGVLLFKLLTDVVDTNTFESIELYQNYIKTYRLDDTEGEDVATSLACFVAVVSMLEARDRPSNIVRRMLEGQKHCHNPDYVGTVKGMLSSTKGPMFDVFIKSEGCNEMAMLHKFAAKLKAESSSYLSKIPSNGTHRHHQKQWV